MVRNRVSIVGLGCARNDIDGEEIAGRLSEAGFDIADTADGADIVIVNTCGFVEAARKDSIDAILEAADGSRAVVAVGCMAERYGTDLSEALPEAAAVLGFDHYESIADRVRDVLAGRRPEVHQPRDRRLILPLAPAERPAAARERPIPGHAWMHRRRLSQGPIAPVKLASGCDRRCSFCAIPSFRGAFVSRSPDEVISEARWLIDGGVREVLLVSENSTSYGKDLGDLRLLESLLPAIAAVPGIERVRVSYLQPAEMRPSLVEVLASTPGVAAYADLSFQHASASVLRRMRRFGDADAFLDLIAALRANAPGIGIRSNVIVGFPGESDDDVDILEQFLQAARLDAIGVFGYSAEEGTEAAAYDDALPEDDVRQRVERVSCLADELMSQRADDRKGDQVRVIVTDADEWSGPASHQGPDDALTRLVGDPGELASLAVGDVVEATVIDADGVDLVASLESPGP